jgi:hypothetical protein
MADVLIGCETSGVVLEAFLRYGHNAYSCDLLRHDKGSNRHIIDDVRNVIRRGVPGTGKRWDFLAVMHPPCTRLCNSGVRWLHEPPGKINADHYTDAERNAYKLMNREERLSFMWQKLDEGARLFSDCWNADIPYVAAENPQMHKYAVERIDNYEPPQFVQPWWFGDPAFKATGLHIKNLPPLVATNKLVPPEKGTEEYKQWSAIHLATPGAQRWKVRSKFWPGIAEAMADQWGSLLPDHEELLAA